MGTGHQILVGVGLALSACAGRGETQPSASVFKSEASLTGLPAGAKPVGVAVGDRGERYVLDPQSGLWELGEGGTATLVFDTKNLLARYGLETEPDFTDIVSLGADRFALTAENDGFLLDLYNQSFEVYFCYLPDIQPEPDPGSQPDAGAEPTPVIVPISISQELQLQGIPVKQRTESVAYSLENFQLFAQPQTFRLDTGEVAGSELFIFAPEGGEPISARALDTNFVAAGMVAIDGERLLLGRANQLFAITVDAGPILIREFDEAVEIAGMALDMDGDLLLLDGRANRLLELARP